MELKRAIEIVVEDQRESYPEMSTREAISHAQQTINPDALYYYGDDNYHAYTEVFAADESRLDEAMTAIEQKLDGAVSETWLHRHYG